ncbi:mesotocin receptor-like [Asterias rubens]|uniref:mesotocin receptor-like n=1 Tax=Asterias rubens TaxID=7604 RepID=UPI0014550A9D|nr:mesotocin receptor-like [Asterias rubens]
MIPPGATHQLNMTEAGYALESSNLTTDGAILRTTPANVPTSKNVHHAGTRIIVLFVLFFMGVIGNCLALLWIWNNRKRRSRVNRIVLGLATADFCVCIFNILVSVIYELQEYRWYAGNVGCKTIMAMQTASLIASSFMLVIMAIDRHQAIRAPLKEGFSVKKMMILGWGLAALFSVPQFFVWELQHRGFDTCRTNLNQTPDKRLIYITFGALITFFFPFGIITVAYIRLSKKIWDKARETSGKPRSVNKKKKMHLQSTGSSSLNRAKIKTLKMSAVIIIMFVLCGLPYFAVEMIRSYNLDKGTINPEIYGIFGIFAVSNSAVNPYVFLWFNKRTKCLKLMRIGPPDDKNPKKRRVGSRGASTSSYSPDDTTKTMIDTKLWAAKSDNNHAEVRNNHVNHTTDIRMDPIREDCSTECTTANVTRFDLNSNV